KTAMESVARLHARDSDIPSVLAFYQVTGRLDVAADPAQQAARRWLADQDAVIVVHDENQERRVRAALVDLGPDSGQAGDLKLPAKASTDVARQAVPDALKDGASQACILQSEVAYEQRQERRRVWQQQSGISLGHIVEPNVIERAYVLAPPADSGGARYD